jgi:hypothetical protein
MHGPMRFPCQSGSNCDLPAQLGHVHFKGYQAHVAAHAAFFNDSPPSPFSLVIRMSVVVPSALLCRWITSLMMNEAEPPGISIGEFTVTSAGMQ